MQADDYVRRAREQTGLQHFHSDSYREGLELLAHSAAHNPRFSDAGRQYMDATLLNSLTERLRIDDWIERHPEVLQTPVARPAFILGLPRTGSTFLHELLAVDSRLRVIWNWETDNCIPPAETAHLHDDPRLFAKKAKMAEAVKAGFAPAHYVDGDDPDECVFTLGQDFKSLLYEHVTWQPEYHEWLYQRADMVAAYRHHKRQLQVLQSRAPGQWMLKLPSHAISLDALFSVYPDAHAIILHRDPLVASASYSSIVHHYQSMTNAVVNPFEVGEQLFPQLLTHTRCVMAYRDAHPEKPFLDIQYHLFKADPLAQIRRIYDFLDMDLPAKLEQDILAYRNANAEPAFGKHQYSLEQFGIDRSHALKQFSEYIERYDIPCR